MVKKRELCNAEKEKIVKLFEKGLSYSIIGKQLYFKKSTVRYVVKKWQKSGTVANTPRSGRRSLMSPRLKSALYRNVLKDRKLSAPKLAVEIKEQYNINVSSKTISRALKSKGLHSRIARKKPFISRANQRKRYQWGKDHAKWSLSDWKKVIWTDESKFNLFGSDGMVRVWRRCGESLHPECLRPTVNMGVAP